MSFFTWLGKVKSYIRNWLASPEDAAIIEFFGPLIDQVKAAALKAGKDNLNVGIEILKEAAVVAVLEAQKSGADKVKVAEETFVRIVKERGIESIENAEAGLIKAAVAIIQSINSKTNDVVATKDDSPLV